MSDFYFLYQPKVKVGEIVGLEALLRPFDSKVSTLEYLDGISCPVEFDLRVIKKCVKEILDFDINVSVSINIHPLSISDHFFVFEVIDLIKNRNIQLELIEHQEVTIDENYLSNINKLKTNGINISIDDFGKDFARADFAITIKVDEVKFDRSLIDGIENNYSKFKHLAFLYSKISTLCTKNIVFEGVESKRQSELIQLFCDEPVIQGYYYYRPMPIGDVLLLEEFTNNKNNYHNVDNPNFEFDFDYKLYKFLAENKSEPLDGERFKEFVKENDLMGVLYNDDIKVIKENIRNIYFNNMSVINNRLVSLVDAADKVFIIRNDQGVAVYENNAHKKLFGKNIVGLQPEIIIKENRDYSVCLEKDRKVMKDNTLVFHRTKELFGGVIYDTAREKVIFNNNNFIITSICASNSGLVDIARDELTNFHTRSYIKNSIENHEDKIVGFLDVNGLKFINDNYGHKAGDMSLSEFSCIIMSSLRKNDVVIRYGGDEFLIIFDSVSCDDIERKLKSLNERVKSFFFGKGYTFSFAHGVEKIGVDGIYKAIERADKKMYEAKRIFKREC